MMNYDTIAQRKPATKIAGGYTMNNDLEFNNEIKNIRSAVLESYNYDIFKDANFILTDDTIKGEYKDALMGSVLESSSQDPYYERHADALSALFENCCEEILLENSVGNMSPVIPLTLPILKKNHYETIGKDVMPVEVPDQPYIQLQFERSFLRDIDGKKYYCPEIFYSDDYKEIYGKTRGTNLPDIAALKAGVPLQNNYDLLTAAGGAMKKFDKLANDVCIDGFVAECQFSSNKTITFAAASDAAALVYANSKFMKDAAKTAYVSGDITAVAGSTGFYKVTAYGEIVEVHGLNIMPVESNNNSLNYTMRAQLAKGNGEDAPEIAEDTLFATFDMYQGTCSMGCSAQKIKKVFFGGHLSNEKNEKMVTVEWERTPFYVKIEDGEKLNTGLTVEKIKDMKALLDIDITTRVISEMSTNLTHFEDNNILDFTYNSFNLWKDRRDLPYGYAGHVEKKKFVEEAMFSAIPPVGSVAMQSDWIASELKMNLDQLINDLKFKLNNTDMMFVIFGNPKWVQLLNSNITWIVDRDAKIGGIKTSYRYGALTNSETRVQILSSQKVRLDKGLRILAYPLTEDAITFKHYKYSLNIEQNYRNSATPNTPNIMVTQRYKTFENTPVQGQLTISNAIFGNTEPNPEMKFTAPGYLGVPSSLQ